MTERECVVVLRDDSTGPYLFSEVVPEVLDLRASSVPLHLTFFLSFLTEHENFHSVVVQGVALAQIEHVEFHALTFCGVANLEIEPLSVTVGVNVVL